MQDICCLSTNNVYYFCVITLCRLNVLTMLNVETEVAIIMADSRSSAFGAISFNGVSIIHVGLFRSRCYRIVTC